MRNCVNRLGTWNVKGINETVKGEEVVGVFRKGKFELLALTETKLIGRDKEGVAVLLNNVAQWLDKLWMG